MPTYLAAFDLQKNELRNARIQNLATAPSSPVEGQIYYNTADHKLYTWDGTIWQAGSGATGSAGGDLSGTYPNPSIGTGAITDAKVAANAAIALSKLATDVLARANHTGTQPASTISDFDTQVRTSRLDQLATPTGDVDLNGQALVNLAEPLDASDAATKGYVDATALGLDVKNSVRAATNANITLSGTQTVDGVALTAGNRVLVKAQSDASKNGIYVVAAGAWARADDADSDTDVNAGLYTFVESGTTNADSGWLLTTDNPITVGTTDLAFTQFSGAGQINPGAGLSKSGNNLDVGGTTDRITVNADSIDIATGYVGQASITTVGTIDTGTWEGDPVDIAFGGTGATTAKDARTALAVPSKFAAANGGTTTDTVTHNLDTEDVVVSIRDVATGQLVEADIYVTDADTVTVEYGAAPTAASLRITVIG